MTLLDNHLEQILLSSAAIAELPFPSPKVFTNALLRSHDITALIRDTEVHERPLFSVAASDEDSSTPRRSTVRPGKTDEAFPNGSELIRRPGHGSAAATLLGGELGERFRREGSKEQKERGEMDVELLLRGAERLCSIYPIPDASATIASLRTRHAQLISSIARFEARVAKQTGQLAKMNRSLSYDNSLDDEENPAAESLAEKIDIAPNASGDYQITVEDIRLEEAEIRELEKKKRALEDRVNGMERDLGGLRR